MSKIELKPIECKNCGYTQTPSPLNVDKCGLVRCPICGKSNLVEYNFEDETSKEKQIELKPCPFCGGKAKVKVCDGSGAFYTDIGTEMYLGRKMTHCLIQCQRCRAKTKAYLTRRGAFDAWNRRVEDERK